MPIQIHLQSMNKARKKGLSWSCLFIRIWLVGSFVRASAASWVCFVQMIGSLCSLFQFFNWFWVLIKCNLRRVSGTPYIPPEEGIFRAGKQNACVCCWSNSENCWRLRKKVPWEKRNVSSWRDKPSNLDLDKRANNHFQNILYSKLFSFGRLSEGSWCLTVVSRCSVSLLHVFFSFFLFLWLVLKFIWFSDSSCL